jgi:UDP-N-acetylmuramate--alanine ligase
MLKVFDLSLHKGDAIHLVGIGGTGLCGVATILAQLGFTVTGSDCSAGGNVSLLRKAGIRVSIGHDRNNVSKAARLVVASAAIPAHNPELVTARKMNVPVVKYSEMLSCLMNGKRQICIAGTHGKTTTAALVSFLLSECGFEPSFLVGGILKNFQRPGTWGRGEFFVAEACEFDRTFLRFEPHLAIITNIDVDHLDCYGSWGALKEGFAAFVSLLPEGGALFCCADDAGIRELLEQLRPPCRVIRFGLGRYTCQWQARNVVFREQGITFELLRDHCNCGRFFVPLLGEHNLANTIGAIALVAEIGVDLTEVRSALVKFAGVERRLEPVIEKESVLLLDDYGHHPAEISAVLKALKEHYGERVKKLVLIFQPHQYSRTRLLFRDFVGMLSKVPVVILPEIFRARDRDQDVSAVSSRQLAEAVNAAGGNAFFVGHLREVVRECLCRFTPGGIVVVMGAGDIAGVVPELREELLKLAGQE